MKTLFLRILFLLLLCSTFFAIFRFSSQNGDESGSLSNKVMTKFINVFPYTKDLSIATKLKLIEHGEPILRKLAHFSIYGLVGIFIMSFMSTFSIRLYQKLLVSLGVGLLYAISDEYHQSFVIGRGPSILDVGIDTAGVFAGILMVLIAISVYKALVGDRKNRILKKEISRNAMEE